MTGPLRSPRRWLPALLIVAAAAAIGLWGARREMHRSVEVERQVAALFRPTPVGPSADLSAMPAVTEQIQRVRRAADASGDEVDLEVVAGDIEPFGDGSATHHVTAAVGQTPMLGLRLVHDPRAELANMRVRVIGYWLP